MDGASFNSVVDAALCWFGGWFVWLACYDYFCLVSLMFSCLLVVMVF